MVTSPENHFACKFVLRKTTIKSRLLEGLEVPVSLQAVKLVNQSIKLITDKAAISRNYWKWQNDCNLLLLLRGMHGRPQKFFQMGRNRHFAYIF